MFAIMFASSLVHGAPVIVTCRELGVVLDQSLRVSHFRDRSCAQRGGVTVGDELQSINAVRIAGRTFADAVRTIQSLTPPLLAEFRRALAAPEGAAARMDGDVGAEATRLAADGVPNALVLIGPTGDLGRVPVAVATFSGAIPHAAHAKAAVHGTQQTHASTPLRLILPEPRYGCTAPSRVDGVAGAAVVIRRGRCAFTEKASVFARLGAAAVIVVNDAGGDEDIIAMPGTLARGDGVTPAVVMAPPSLLHRMPAHARRSLGDVYAYFTSARGPARRAPAAAMRAAPARAAAASTANAAAAAGEDHASARRRERRATSREARAPPSPTVRAGAIVHDGSGDAYEFLAAHFGAALREAALGGERAGQRLVAAAPRDACSALDGAHYRGAAVLVWPGGACDVERKAAEAERAGASVVVVVGGEPDLRPHTPEDGLPSQVAAHVIAVSSRSGAALEAAARGGATVRLTHSPLHVHHARAWTELQPILGRELAWPGDASARRRLFKRLHRRHRDGGGRGDGHGSEERAHAVSAAYERAEVFFLSKRDEL